MRLTCINCGREIEDGECVWVRTLFGDGVPFKSEVKCCGDWPTTLMEFRTETKGDDYASTPDTTPLDVTGDMHVWPPETGGEQ